MKYVCPMHPEIQSDKKGRCDICGMQLVKNSEIKHHSGSSDSQNSYKPLIIVLGLILLTSVAISYRDSLSGQFEFNKLLSYFMAGFFIVFSGFKLVDLKGFAEGYSQYDLLAKKIYEYGYVYPFIELFFGIAMIVNPFNETLLWSQLVIMAFSGLGVLIKILKKERFQCACLGTFLKVPLTYVTLVEDFGMAALAAYMLFVR